MKKYALRHKKSKKIVCFEKMSNQGQDCCVSVTCDLKLDDGRECPPRNIWYADSAEHAEWVRLNSTPWFNADYKSPRHHDLEAEDLEVVTVEIKIKTETVETSIPTVEEFYSRKYEKKNPKHLKELLKEIKTGHRVVGYLYSEYLSLIEEEKKEENKIMKRKIKK